MLLRVSSVLCDFSQVKMMRRRERNDTQEQKVVFLRARLYGTMFFCLSGIERRESRAAGQHHPLSRMDKFIHSFMRVVMSVFRCLGHGSGL